MSCQARSIIGAEVLVRTLMAHGIDCVFGTSGTTFRKVLDALVGTRVEYILCLHESSAAAAADGYARATGKPAFVIVHDTAGTANLIGSLSLASLDRTPLVIVAAQRDTTSLPSANTPHESHELIQMTGPFTKWSWQVPRTEQVSEALLRAFGIALTPPAGPVFLGISQRILEGSCDWNVANTQVVATSWDQPWDQPCDQPGIERAARLLLCAENPVIVAGNEVARAGAVPDLVALAELVAARVVTEPYISFTSFPSSHPLYLGVHHKNPRPVEAADVLLGAGCRLFLDKGHTYIPPVAKGTKVIHILDDPWELGRTCPVEAGILGNVRTSLRALARAVENLATDATRAAARSRAELVRTERSELEESAERAVETAWKETSCIEPLRLLRTIRERLRRETLLGRKAVVVDEAVTMSTQVLSQLDFDEPASYFSRSGLYLGWGLPAATGIKLAFPDREVIAFVGDGSFMFSLQALWTASRYKIPVKVVVLNNHGYQAIRSELMQAVKDPGCRDLYPGSDVVSPEIDFVKIAAGFDVWGKSVRTPGEIGPAFDELLKERGPALLDVVVNQGHKTLNSLGGHTA